MSHTHIFGSVQPRRASDWARASKVDPSSTTSADTTNTYSRSAKETEHLAEKLSNRVQSQNQPRTSVGYDYFEPSPHKRLLDLEIPSKTSSDMFSPPIPTSPLPQYSYPPPYSPPRRSKELPKEAVPGPQRRTPTRPTPREVSPPPKYHKEDVVDLSDLYSGGKARSAGRSKPRSKPIDTVDCYAIAYHLVKDHTVDMTPPKPGRLALAASRESQSNKKEFELYKRQTRNQVPSRTEELDDDPEVDDLQKSILGEIAAIGGSSSRHPATQGAIHHALNAERAKAKL